jgi:hypothetical protein
LEVAIVARIKTVSEQDARGIRKVVLARMRRQYGYIPGISKILLVDLALGRRMGAVYNHLQLRRSSPLTRLQREMLAVVVNGHVNGAP